MADDRTATPSAGRRHGYDVFLSHNGDDKDAVVEIAHRLKRAGVEPFLDTWHLVPGEPWQEALEAALDASRSCAVFLGPEGFGPWENEEMRAALSRRVNDDEYRVIPVLLPGAKLPQRGRLPAFLSRVTWVDFRAGLDDEPALHRLINGVRGVAPDQAGDDGPKEADAIVCPFRGLEVFDEDHAEFFFGREALTQHLVEQLRADRFLCVLGPSGSGKSSLVRAGLVPALRGGALTGSRDWQIEVVRPGANPMEALASRLVMVTGAGGDALGTRNALLETLERDERGLHSIVQLAVKGDDSDDRVVIVVDQFEEVFTLTTDETVRNAFVASLLYASSVAGGATVVVTTMRADFFGKCAAIPNLAARLSERDVLVPPMNEDELRRAIIQPAERVGLQFEKGLVDRILADLAGEPGALPLLQHTLLELFDGRRDRWLTVDHYQAIGGVQGAIAQRAEAVYGHLNPEQQLAARRVLLRLTQPGEGTEDTRRRAQVTELIPSGPTASQVEAVVNELAAARLLTTSRDESGQEVVDVAHEALIRGWPRLQQWVDENPTALRIHRDLTLAAEAWSRNGRDRSYIFAGPRLDESVAFAARNPDELNELERSFLRASVRARQARTLRLIGALVAVIVVFAVLGGLAVWQRNAADEAAAAAVAAAANARSAQADADIAAARAEAQALLSEGLFESRDHAALGTRLVVEAMVRAERAGVALTRFRQEVAEMVASGRYASIPTVMDEAWTDPQGRVIVGGPRDGPASVIDTRDGHVFATLRAPVEGVRFPGAADAGIFVVDYGDGEHEIRRLADGSLVPVTARIEDVLLDVGNAGEVAIVVYGSSGDTATRSPDGRPGVAARLASTQASDPPPDPDTVPAQVVRIVDGTVVRDLDGPAAAAALAGPDGPLGVVSYNDGGITLVRLRDGSALATIPSMSAVAEAPVGGALVVRDQDDSCGLMTVDAPVMSELVPGCEEAVFSADGTMVAFGGSRIAVYDVGTRRRVATIDSDKFLDSFSPDPAHQGLLVGDGYSVDLFSTRSGHRLASFTGNVVEQDGQPGVTYSPDGSLVALRFAEGLRVLSTRTGKIVLSGAPPPPSIGDISVPPIGVQTVSFSSDGHWILVSMAGTDEVRRAAAPTESTGYVVSGTFWPGTGGALVVGSQGIAKVDAATNVSSVFSSPAEMTIRGFAPGAAPRVALVEFTSFLDQTVPPVSLLGVNGQLLPLEGAHVFDQSFSPDGRMLALTSSGRIGTLWSIGDIGPRKLTTFAGTSLVTWDPLGTWVMISTQTGETSLLSVPWLARLPQAVVDAAPEELERLVCTGPPASLVDDASLSTQIHATPESCR